MEFDQLKIGLFESVELPRFFEALHSRKLPNIEVQKMQIPENVFYIFSALYKKRQIEFISVDQNKRKLEFYQMSIKRENFGE